VSELHADTLDLLGRTIQQCVLTCEPVEIAGLGSFRLLGGRLEFTPWEKPRVFLAYVAEDYPRVAKIYEALEAEGFDPWLDRRKLLAGQDWQGCIDRAISGSDFFVPCFSARALRKRGQFQRELRLALETEQQFPLDDQFVTPVRLEPCDLPRRIRSRYQYIDLFGDMKAGIAQLLASFHTELARRKESA
jgi:hypothetical protein